MGTPQTKKIPKGSAKKKRKLSLSPSKTGKKGEAMSPKKRRLSLHSMHKAAVTTPKMEEGEILSDDAQTPVKLVTKSPKKIVRNNLPINPENWNTINIFGSPHATTNILVLREGQCALMYGACRVMALAGEAWIDGFKLRAAAFDESRLIPVCAPHRMGRPAVFHGASHEVVEKESRIQHRIREVWKNDEIFELYKKNPTTTSVLMIDKRPSTMATILGTLGDHMLLPPRCDSSWAFFRNGNRFAMYTHESVEQLVKMDVEIDEKRVEGDRFVIVPVGAKGSGKSSFVRRFVNQMLSKSQPSDVYVLDADIGQAEMTPAGCMSLWKVTKPMTDLPFAHQSTSFPLAYLFGDISLETDVSRYNQIITRLYKRWQAEAAPGSVLIVNTLGFVEAAGAEVLDHIFETMEPFAAVSLFQNPFVVATRKTAYNFPHGQRVLQVQRGRWNLDEFGGCSPGALISPPILRELSVLGHLAHVLPTARPHVSRFAEVPPYQVNFSTITLSIPEDLSSVEDRYILGTINCTLVALGYYEEDPVDARRILDSDNMPRVKVVSLEDPAMVVVGYGIVRAIDLERKLFYLLTPIPASQLHQVNTFGRISNVHLPHCILNTQTQCDVPYIARSKQRRAVSVQEQTFLQDMYKGLRPVVRVRSK